MINTDLILNVYKYRSLKSPLSTQLLYGEKFKIIKKFGKFLKIKTAYDNYFGYIKNKKFKENFTNLIERNVRLTRKKLNLN